MTWLRSTRSALRRKEVAMLADVSVDYYTRLERGNLAGASESVPDALARALSVHRCPACPLHGYATRTWQ